MRRSKSPRARSPARRAVLVPAWLPPPVWCAIAVAVRLWSALCTVTYAAPDEHWQAPEVAHKLVFGVGYVCVVGGVGGPRCLL